MWVFLDVNGTIAVAPGPSRGGCGLHWTMEIILCSVLGESPTGQLESSRYECEGGQSSTGNSANRYLLCPCPGNNDTFTFQVADLAPFTITNVSSRPHGSEVSL